MHIERIRRVLAGRTVLPALATLLLVGCASGDAVDVVGPDPSTTSTTGTTAGEGGGTDRGATAGVIEPSDGTGPAIVVDPPSAFGLDGCSDAPAAAVAALRALVGADVELGPVVSAPVLDDRIGGIAVGAMVLDDQRDVVVLHWDPAEQVLRPLTPEAAALVGPDADTSLVGAGRDPDGAETGALGVPIAQDCATARGDTVAPPPPAPPPTVREDLIEVSPATVTPGEVVEVTYPGGLDRGIAFALEREDDTGRWVDVWWLTSDANGGDPVTVPAGTEGHAVPDVGVTGAGPDRVLVDPATAAGTYRLCTANAREDVCALVTVTR